MLRAKSKGVTRGVFGTMLCTAFIAATATAMRNDARPTKGGVNRTKAPALRVILASVAAFLVLSASPAYSGVVSGTVSIYALAIDPVTATAVFAASNGGVFKSMNGGVTWSATGLTLMNTLAIDPRTPTTVYAGGDGGVFKSTNGGASWSLALTIGTGATVVSLAIDPVTPTNLYAGASDGVVWKSVDAGATWTATGGFAGVVSSIAIDPVTPITLYAASFEPGLYPSWMPTGGVYKSTDGGASWSPTVVYYTSDAAFYCSPCGGPVALAIDPSNPSTLFHSTDRRVEWDADFQWYVDAPGELFKSIDGGVTWMALPGAPGSTGLAVLPRTDRLAPATVYAAGDGVFKSTDGGASWSASGMEQQTVYDLAIDPVTSSTMYAGSATQGVFKSTNGGATWTQTGQITWLQISSLTLNPTSVLGGGSSTGTVTLSGPAPAEGAKVILEHNNSLSATVPSSVTVPAGATSADFTVSTNPVAYSTTTFIRALYGNVEAAATLTLTSAPTVSVLSVQPTSVPGGSTSTGTVTLSAAAPAGGVVVTLSSSNTAVAAVPVSVTVPAGATTVGLVVTTRAVTSATTVTISATSGSVTQSAALTVTPQPPPALVSITLSPTSVTAGTSSTATITLSGAAPLGGVTVTLSSSNTAVATVPGGVTVLAGSTTATFAVATSAVTTSSTVTISGASGGATRSAQLTVTPPATLTSLSLQPTSVPGGSTSTGTVTLNAAAPAGGVVVTLSSANMTVATVPGTVTVPAGSTTATFAVATSAVMTSTTVTISGTAGGATRTATLTVNPPVTLSSLSLQPTTVKGGTPSTGTVTLSGPAPTGGVTVALSSDSPVAQVPNSVIVLAGATSTTFTVSTGRPASNNTPVRISASLPGVTVSTTLTVKR